MRLGYERATLSRLLSREAAVSANITLALQQRRAGGRRTALFAG